MGKGLTDSTRHQSTVKPGDDDLANEGAAAVSERALDYALLMKPRVMSLVVFTGVVGLLLAPGPINPLIAVIAILCIAVGAGASGAINMWYDRDIDQHMERTRERPIPAGRVSAREALWLGSILAVASVLVMTFSVNAVAGALLAVTIAYYIFIYTIWLKRRTPQNIVIGGASGAFPPVIGWAAVTGGIDAGAVALFLIIFMWTPPHFWALALFRSGDYERVNIPMLPVVAGRAETRRQMLIYTVLLIPVTLSPWALGMSGPLYGVLAAVLGGKFLWHAVRVYRDDAAPRARAMFFFSIVYLFLIFLGLLLDRFIAILAG